MIGAIPLLGYMPIAAGIVYIPAAIKAAMLVKMGKFNNVEPRQVMRKLTDDTSEDAALARRAVAAHENSWEALILFIGGVLAAKVAGVDNAKAVKLAQMHIVARLGFQAVYIFFPNVLTGNLRSLIFFAGTGCSFALMVLAAKAAK